MRIDARTKAVILAFVHSVVPGGCISVWLSGSRVAGTARPDSDWDVVAFHPDAPRKPECLFKSNQIGPIIEGGPVELIIRAPGSLERSSAVHDRVPAQGPQTPLKQSLGVTFIGESEDGPSEKALAAATARLRLEGRLDGSVFPAEGFKDFNDPLRTGRGQIRAPLTRVEK